VITGSRLGWLPAVNISWTGLSAGGRLPVHGAGPRRDRRRSGIGMGGYNRERWEVMPEQVQ